MIHNFVQQYGIHTEFHVHISLNWHWLTTLVTIIWTKTSVFTSRLLFIVQYGNKNIFNAVCMGIYNQISSMWFLAIENIKFTFKIMILGHLDEEKWWILSFGGGHLWNPKWPPYGHLKIRQHWFSECSYHELSKNVWVD